jgi:MFS family permease
MSFLKSLPRNSRVCLYVEPLWALFGPATFFYGSLYMKELGLSPVEIGLVASVNLAVSFLFYLVAGPLTDKLGRRKASLFFDFVAWPVSMMLWSFATGFWWFMAGAVTNAAVRVVIVSWNLLMSEDAPKEARVKLFGAMSIMSACGGFVTMIAGFLRDRVGLEPVMRGLYLVGGASMAIMIVIRWIWADETASGKLMIEKSRGRSLPAMVVEQLRSFAGASKDKEFLRIAALYFIVNASISFNGFQAIYAKDFLGYAESQIAWIPGVNALICILLFVLVLPRVAKRGGERIGLALSFGLSLLASALFMVVPSGALPLLLLAFALSATALQLTATYRETVFMNHSNEETRAELFGIVQTIAMLLSIPSGYLAGLLYEVHPVLPFAANLAFFGAGIALSLKLTMTKSTHVEAA